MSNGQKLACSLQRFLLIKRHLRQVRAANEHAIGMADEAFLKEGVKIILCNRLFFDCFLLHLKHRCPDEVLAACTLVTQGSMEVIKAVEIGLVVGDTDKILGIAAREDVIKRFLQAAKK